MNIKERIVSTLNGEWCDVLPFLPRMDNWYLSNKINDTLPSQFKNATLRQITDELGFGYHALNPDWGDYHDDNGGDHVGIGFYDLKLKPYVVKIHNVEIEIEKLSGGITKVEYTTPKGKITTCEVYNDFMVKAGCTLHVVTEHAVKSCDDLDAMAYILENVEIIPNYDALAEFKTEFMGNRGLTVALSEVYCSPIHYLQKVLMSLDSFYYALCDEPEKIEEFEQKVRPYCEKIFDMAANSPCDAVLSGSNFDSALTGPQMYRDYMLPYIQKQSAKLQSMGKYHVCHTDGENTGLIALYLESGFDIADSICPAPMTKLSLKNIRDSFSGKITIWGGIPSISTLKDSMSDYDFEKHIDEMLLSIGNGDHFIVSIADTLPPDADFKRVMHIAKKVSEFGQIKATKGERKCL